MKKLFICLSIACLTFTSCSVVKSTATSAKVEPVVLQAPTIADVNINKTKVTKTVRWNFVPFRLGDQPLLDRKENLVAELIKENNGDVLVEPQWQFTKVSFGERTLTVTGYVGTYTDFHKATPEEIEAAKVLREARPQDNEPRPALGNFGKRVAKFFH